MNKPLLILLTLWCLSGCSSLSQSPNTTVTLDQWLHLQVLPDIHHKLQTLPILKGQPLLIAGIDNGTIISQPNEVIKKVQRRMIDSLLANPSIMLTNTGNHQADNETDLTALSCGINQEADILIGITAETVISENMMRITVRAYDTNDDLRLLNGINYHFEENLTPHLNQLLEKTTTDKASKGSRRLPFDENEADNLADSLSQQVACILSQSSQSNIILNVLPQENNSPFLETTTALVAKNLNAFQQISVTNILSQANTQLNIDSVLIAKNQRLHLISADIADRDNRIIGGASAQAYARHHPIINEASLSNNEIIKRVTETTAPTKRPFQFTSFKLLLPEDIAACRSQSPWSQGESQLENGQRINENHCFAVEASTNDISKITLIYQSPNRQLQRMLPTSCALFEDIDDMLASYEIMRFPSINGRVKALDLGEAKGAETFYVIATSDAESEKYISNRINKVVDICEATKIVSHAETFAFPRLNNDPGTDIESWLVEAKAKFPNQLIWKKKSFVH